MKNSILSLEGLRKAYRPEELKDKVLSILKQYSESQELRGFFHEHKDGLFSFVREELYLLAAYTVKKYSKNDVLIYPSISDKVSYDAEIRNLLEINIDA